MANHATLNLPPPRLSIDVPPGWIAAYHELLDLDPEMLAPEASEWQFFSQDLLQFRHSSEDLQEIGLEPTEWVLDVGWYPDSSPAGEFVLVLIQGTDWQAPLVRFATRSLKQLAARLSELLQPPPFQQPEPDRPLDALLNADDDIRMAAVKAIARIGDPAAGEALITQLVLPEAEDPIRRLIIKALGWIRYAPATALLITWLENPDPWLRSAAAWSLAAIADSGALPAVNAAYLREQHERARDEMRWAVYRLVQVKDGRPR